MSVSDGSYIQIVQYGDSPTGHVNVAFYDPLGRLVGAYGANVDDIDLNPFNGFEGGVYNETDMVLTRPAEHVSRIDLPYNSWLQAYNYANNLAQQTASTGDGYYFLFGENCVDFVEDILSVADIGDSASPYLMPGSMLRDYADLVEQLSWFREGPDIMSWLRNDKQSAENFTKFHDFWKIEEALKVSKHSEGVKETEDRVASETEYSPIVIDTNGDGIEILPLSKSDVSFDLNQDGVREKTAWVAPGDSFLFIDLNHNGNVDDGGELFGGRDRGEGFLALSKYDDNSDGVISSVDLSYGSLQMWDDKNGNGVSEEGEISSLKEMGVDYISLQYISWDDYDGGNLIGEHSTALVNGDIVRVVDIYFSTIS